MSGYSLENKRFCTKEYIIYHAKYITVKLKLQIIATIKWVLFQPIHTNTTIPMNKSYIAKNEPEIRVIDNALILNQGITILQNIRDAALDIKYITENTAMFKRTSASAL